MKIAFITGSLNQGGAERVICSLANELVERQHYVIIYTLVAEKSFYALDKNVRRINIKFDGRNIFKNLDIIYQLRNRLRIDKPDVLISFDSRTLVYSVMARINKIAIVYSERSNPRVYPPQTVWRCLRDLAIKKTKLCVFQTQSVLSLYPKLVNKSVVIPNAIFNPILKDIQFPQIRENVISVMGRLNCKI